MNALGDVMFMLLLVTLCFHSIMLWNIQLRFMLLLVTLCFHCH